MDAAVVRLVTLGCAIAGAIIAFSTAIAGCARLFGLDEPTLACESGGECPDASVPDSVPPTRDASDGGERESAMDASLDGDEGDNGGMGDNGSPNGDASAEADAEAGPAGIRCGPPDASPPYCTMGTVCCAELAADGGISFSCKGSCSAPTGYTINCADSRNCDPLDCCHESSGMFCRQSCPGALVCDPMYRACKTKTCKAPLSILGQSSTAYLGCN
jgi:hypothetical protein